MYEFDESGIVLGDTFFRGGFKNAFRAYFTGKQFHNVRFYDMKESSFEECAFVMCDFTSESELIDCSFFGCTFIACTFKSPAFKEPDWCRNKFTDCYFEKVDCCIDGELVGKNFLCVGMVLDREHGAPIYAVEKEELIGMHGARDFTVFWLHNDVIAIGQYGKTITKKLLTSDAAMLNVLGGFIHDLVRKGRSVRFRSEEFGSSEMWDTILNWVAGLSFVHDYRKFKPPKTKFVSMKEIDVLNMKYFPSLIQFDWINHQVVVHLWVIKSREFKRARLSKRKKT